MIEVDDYHFESTSPSKFYSLNLDVVYIFSHLLYINKLRLAAYSAFLKKHMSEEARVELAP